MGGMEDDQEKSPGNEELHGLYTLSMLRPLPRDLQTATPGNGAA